MAAIATHTSAYTHTHTYTQRTDGGSQHSPQFQSPSWRRSTATSFDAYARLSYLYACAYPFSFSFNTIIVVVVIVVARNSSFLCALCVCLHSASVSAPVPSSSGVFGICKLMLAAATQYREGDIMQIFSQCFPLFVVGFSFRFLNNKKANNFAAATFATTLATYCCRSTSAAAAAGWTFNWKTTWDTPSSS